MKEDLDAIALCVSAPVETRLSLASWVRTDDGLDFQRFQLSAYRVGVVAGVGYERFAPRVVRDDRFGDSRLVLLPLRDFDVERAPFGVDERVDLCGESTS